MSRSRGILLFALLLLGVGWVVAPRSAPPLYDGVGFPDEPYRFVQSPPGTRVTKPPTTAEGTAGVTAGRNGQLDANSAESAPQVSVTIPAEMLRVPAGTAPPLTLVARPQKALPPPPGKYLWSNVYDVTITPAVTFTARADLVATIILRAVTAQQPLPFIARFDAGRWTSLPTAPVGLDVYAATLTSVGRFAVIGETPLDLSQLRAGGKSGGARAGIFAGAGVIAAVVALFVLGRWRRARARPRVKDR